MKAVLACVLSLAAFSASAQPLDRKEWALEAGFLAAGLIDYGQTRDLKNHPNLHERNPFLGRHPSDDRIRNYFLAAGLAHMGITRLLPREYRPYWQWGTLVLEVGVVARNHSIGLRVDF
jgi:hypothetical protein